MQEGKITHVLLIGTIVSLFLQMIGCLTPGWVYIVADNEHFHLGLWYYVYCDGTTCVTQGTLGGVEGIEGVNDHYLSRVMVTYIALTVSGIIVCMLAVLFLVSNRRASEPINNGTLIIALLLAATCALALSAALKFAVVLSVAAQTYAKDNNPYMFPYSVFLSGSGGFLALVMFFTVVCKTRCK